MRNRLCPKIILEGTRLTLKADIALALNEHPHLLDVSDSNVSAAVEPVADWMEQTSGLYRPD